MHSEQSSIDILKSIAKREGWDIDVKARTQSIRHGYTLRDVRIKNYEYKNCWFISKQTTRSDKYRCYSGIFAPLSLKYEYKLLIRRRDFMDKLNFRKDKLRFKVGNGSFDSKIYIETNNDVETHKLLSSSGMQANIIEFLESSERLEIGIGNNDVEIEDNSAKNYVSVITYLDWMLDKKLIDRAFSLAYSIQKKFN